MAETARQKRIRELGVATSDSDISSRQRRKIELGVSSPAPALPEMTNRQKRRIELGVISDTRATDSYDEYQQTHNQFELDPLQVTGQKPKFVPAPQQLQSPAHNNVPSGAEHVSNYEARKDLPSRQIPIVGDLLSDLDKVSDSKFTDVVGGLGRLFYTPGASAANIAGMSGAASTAITKVANKLAPDLAQTFGGKVAQTALREGITGAPLGVGQSLATGQDDEEALKGGAYGAVLGGVLGSAGSAVVQKLQGTKLGEALRSFIGKPKVEIPQPTYANPTRLKVAGTEEAFNAVIPKVFTKATERMTPPLENPNELAKWVRNHLNDEGHDVSLNEVRTLNYEDLRELSEEMRSKIKIPDLVRKTAHDMGYGDIYEGIPPNIKQMMAYDAQSRVYGVPAPDIKVSRTIPNERTTVVPPERIVNKPLPVSPIRDPNEPIVRETVQPIVNKHLNDSPFIDPNDIVPSAKANQVTKPSGARTDGLTIMQKYFPDGRVDGQILGKLPLEERLQFQLEQTPGYKPPVRLDARGLPSDASHLKNTPAYLREEIGRNNAIADNLGLADEIEDLFSQGLTSKEVRQKLTYKLPSDYNEAKAVVESVRSFRGIPSSSETAEFSAWLKKRGSSTTEAVPPLTDDAALNNLRTADDVIDVAEPRISSKVTGYLEDEIAAAKERIAAKRYNPNPEPSAQNADHALVGVTYIENGTTKLADFTEQMVRHFGEEIRPRVKDIFKQSKELFKSTEQRISKDLQGLTGVVPEFLKDTSGFTHDTSDIYRVFKNVFKDKFSQVKKSILDPLDTAKLENVRMQEEWLDKMHTEVVEGLGIDKGSKLSALVQRFGEKDIDLLELQKLAPKDWEKVVEADKFFRNAYDTIVDQVNATRKQIYPHNPDKLVPKRSDYYRHFKEFSGLTGLKNIFDTPAGIDPHLVGVSENTLPKSKFAGFMQKRGLGEFKNDAVGGFLEYIPGASYATHIDPQINVFKNLSKNIASETEKTKNLNHFIKFLQEYSQDLAGKTNNYDRLFQEKVPGGRKSFKVINWVNGRVKSNTILGNAASAVAQIGNIPAGVAFTKQYAFKGAGRTLLSAVRGDPLHNDSQFLKERFLGKAYRKFDTKWLDMSNPLKLKNAAVWVLESADRLGTEFTWNSVYEKGLKEGVKNPIKYADDETRRLVAGRGIGEVPLLQKSKLFQTVAPFTLEVANLWRVQKDFIKSKDFAGLALLMLGSFAFNKVAEEVRGSGVMFDPIQAMREAAADGLNPAQRVGRLAGEVVSNVPLGGTLASIYPENGNSFLGLEKVFGDLPTRKELFGDNDPTRFGSGIIAAKGLEDPLFKLLPGFGGNQLNKTIDGVKSVINEETSVNGKLKTPIEMNPLKAAQTITFGPNSTKEMQTYFDNEQRPLSEKQTQQYNSLTGEQRVEYFKGILKQREIDKLVAAKNAADKDPTLNDVERQKQVDALIKKYNEILQSK